MQNQHAFTLIELLFYLAIVALISAFSLVNLYSFQERQRSRQAAISFHNFIHYSRQSALLLGKTLSLCASEDGLQCNQSQHWGSRFVLLFIDSNKSGQIQQASDILREFNLSPYQGSIQWRSFGNKPYLRWQSNGTTYYQNGSFLFCPKSKNAKHGFLLVINTLGRSYLSKDSNNDGIVEDSNGQNIRCN